MTVTLATAPFSNWQNLAPLLTALGCACEEENRSAQWYLDGDVPSEGYLLLTYACPEQTLITAMENGTAPTEVLSQWAKHARSLVDLFKANRRRAVLIDVSSASKDIGKTAQRLSEHWQLTIELPESDESLPKQPSNPYYRLIANQAVQQSPSLQPLLAQLEACTLPLGEEVRTRGTSQDIDELFVGLKTLWQRLDSIPAMERQYAALQSEKVEQDKTLQNVREESELLLEQLHLVQEDLEQKVLAQKSSQSDLANVRNELKTLEKSYTALEQTNNALQEIQQKEHVALQEQISSLEKARSALQKEQAALKQEKRAHTKTNAERATLENQLKALTSANRDQAEQVTALENQLKQARKESQQSQNALEEENQLLIEQLHLVQEELEAKFLQLKEQEQALAKVQAQLKHSEQRHQAASEEIAASQREKQLLQRRMLKLRETMENLERSNKALNGNLAEVKNQLAAAKKHQANWEQKYHQVEREGALALAFANRRITELSTELNSVTKSRSWRLANPASSYTKKSKKAAAEKLESQKAEVQRSGLFDENWYLETYPDVAKAELNPIEHYLKTGAYEGRNPSETFDTTWYLAYYRDVTESGLNPLIHYIRYGQKEQRAPRPGALASLPAPQPQPAEKQK